MDRRTKGRPSRTAASLKTTPHEVAYRAGVLLLTIRDRTRAELTRLLSARGFAQADVQAALDRLKEQGYLDDERFAATWARSRLRAKPMGPYRLSKELEGRGVDGALVREVVRNAYEEGEEPIARRAMAGKLLTVGRLSAASRTPRVARFLQRRGFSSDVIRRLLYEEQ